jgi:hypothetical protein
MIIIKGKWQRFLILKEARREDTIDRKREKNCSWIYYIYKKS